MNFMHKLSGVILHPSWALTKQRIIWAATCEIILLLNILRDMKPTSFVQVYLITSILIFKNIKISLESLTTVYTRGVNLAGPKCGPGPGRLFPNRAGPARPAGSDRKLSGPGRVGPGRSFANFARIRADRAETNQSNV